MTNEEAIVTLIEMSSKVDSYLQEEKFYQAIAHVAIQLGKVETVCPPHMAPLIRAGKEHPARE